MIEQLRAVELKLVDDIFGMSSGYVLDFTNAQFADFFRREVGIDIYDDAYASNGTSKGKRLKALLTIGRRQAIARTLLALWEYREADRLGRGQPDTVVNARQRLTAVVERLGGTPLPSFDGMASAEKEEARPSAFRPGEAALQQLEEKFLALHEMSDEPQARGLHFERLLTDLLNVWRMDARGGFRLAGEQIDGSFQLDGSTYLVEAKWHRAKTDASTLHGFQGKVSERPEWTRGLFVSFAGFTEVGLQAFTARKVILTDGMDIYEALARRLSIPALIAAKVRHASEYRRPFGRVRELFPI